MAYRKHGKNILHPEFPHGEFAGYRAGCRCALCMKGNSLYKAKYKQKLYAMNPDYLVSQREDKRKYRKTVRGIAVYKSSNAKRRQRINKTINNSELLIRIYINCPDDYQVDHIYPLSKGGEHIPQNLQYLPKAINNKKHAKVGYDYSENAIKWQDIVIGTFNDYPKREYTQASGNGAYPVFSTG